MGATDTLKSIEELVENPERGAEEFQSQFELFPKESILTWYTLFRESFPCRLSGQSLKFIRSGLPVTIFEVERDIFDKLTKLITEEQLNTLDPALQERIKKTTVDEFQVKFILKTQTGPDEHCLFHLAQQAQPLEARVPLRISLDRLFYDPDRSTWEGEEQALSDLNQEIIRVVQPDALKTANGIQVCILSSMLDFALEADSLAAARAGFSVTEAEQLPVKFMLKQFKKLLCGARPSAGFLCLESAGMLDWFLPELARGRGLMQNQYHKYDIFFHSMYACDAVAGPNLPIRMAALFHDLGKVDTRKEGPNGEASFHSHEVVSSRHTERIMRRFGFENWMIRRIKFLVRNHMFHYTSEWTDRAIRRFMNRIRPEVLQDLITLRLADRKGSGKRTALPRALRDMIMHMEEVRNRDQELRVGDLQINGHDLMEMGVQPGPKMGELLHALLGEVKAGELENEAEALKDRVGVLLDL